MTGTEPAVSGDDLRNSIASAMDAPAADVAADVAPPADEADEFMVKEDAPKGDRNEKGQFAKKDSNPAEKPTPEQQLYSAPAHWGGSSKVRWDKLPARVQEAISKDYETYGKEKAKYEALEQILAPRRQQLLMHYGDEARALNALFAYSDYAAKDPIGFLRQFSQERGVDLSQLLPKQPDQQGADPQLSRYVQEINQLKQELNSLKGNFTSESTRTLQAQIDDFARNPKFPYFNDVRVSMGALIEAAHQRGQKLSLEQAYDMAVYADPRIRSELLEAQSKAEQAEKLKKVNEAKAAKTPIGAPGSGGSVNPSPAKTVRDEILNSFAAYG